MPLSLDKYPVKTGKSNVLSFFFDPLSTSLKETVNDGNYVYNYFFLSGVESKTKPVGVPFIQKKYHNGILISTDKRIGVR